MNLQRMLKNYISLNVFKRKKLSIREKTEIEYYRRMRNNSYNKYISVLYATHTKRLEERLNVDKNWYCNLLVMISWQQSKLCILTIKKSFSVRKQIMRKI